jgi:hypothetical protein
MFLLYKKRKTIQLLMLIRNYVLFIYLDILISVKMRRFKELFSLNKFLCS